MKKLIVILGMLFSVYASAQVVERENISVEYTGMTSIITMNCLDADKLLPENSNKSISDFGITDAMIQISSKKVTDTLYTVEFGCAVSTKAFRSKKIHFTVSKEGYETLEQDFDLTKPSVCLYIYLKKKK